METVPIITESCGVTRRLGGRGGRGARNREPERSLELFQGSLHRPRKTHPRPQRQRGPGFGQAKVLERHCFSGKCPLLRGTRLLLLPLFFRDFLPDTWESDSKCFQGPISCLSGPHPLSFSRPLSHSGMGMRRGTERAQQRRMESFQPPCGQLRETTKIKLGKAASI